MDFITWLANTTYKFLDVDEVIKLFNEKHYKIAERIILRFRKKKIKVDADIAKQLARNGLINFWSEFSKYIIVLLIATKLNIFLPAFIIMNIFSVLRWVAGGVHMSTFNKCFAVMIGFFISLGYIVSHIHIGLLLEFIFLTISFLWSYYTAFKYAPQERPDKSDKDCDNGNKMKYMTIKFVIISYLISLVFIQHTLISLSIFSGVLLEMFTITPLGTNLFRWIDKRKVFK